MKKTNEEKAWFLEETMKYLHRAEEAAKKADASELEVEIKDVGIMAKKQWGLLFKPAEPTS